MIKTTIIKKLSIFIVVLLFISCSKDNLIDNKETLVSDHFVGLAEIEAIASGIEFPNGNYSNLKSTGPKTKSVSSIDEIQNIGGETLFYIINYEEGGFIILSSDKRSIPVLAYSTENNFVIDENSHSPGLKFWMDDAKSQMEEIRSLSSEQSRISETAWESIQTSLIGEVSSLKKEPPPDCYEHTEIFTEGPFTVPTWHQRSPFNEDLPTQVCDGETEHIRAGCVAIALAAIMRYNEHPSSYNWSSMPYTYGNSTIAAFIEDIHDKAEAFDDDSDILYGCGWTAVVISDIELFLKSEFGYTSADFGTVNHTSLKTDIINERPVYMEGSPPSGPGHAWVVNGYRTYTYYDDDCNSWSSTHYHCVWGWPSTSENGFFKFGYFNPAKADGSGNHSFNSDIKVCTNIIP